jgi:hypothetical protein
MARPPLPLGGWGLIRTTRDARVDGGKPRFRDLATFRDYDGSTRQVEASGRSKTAAEQNLRRMLQGRQAEGGRRGELTGMTRFADASRVWLEGLDDLVEQGRQLENHVLPALGEMRLGEITTPAVDRALTGIRRKVSGAPPRSRVGR